MMFTLGLLLAMALASCPHRNNRHKEISSSSSSSSLAQQGVAVTIDSGIYPFTFGKGNQGDYADQYFYFWIPANSNPNIQYELLVTDCYCGGDRFVILDDHKYGSTTQYAFSTCSNGTPTCNVFYEDPRECVVKVAEEAFAQNDLCFVRYILTQETFHNITIQIATSPFDHGTGFLWLATYDNVSDRPLCYNQQPPGWDQCLLTVQDY